VKTKTSVQAGLRGVRVNHSETLIRVTAKNLKVRTHVRAGKRVV
jgi:hypothetical protein